MSGSSRPRPAPGDCKETDRCCCKHQQCTAHIIHPFDYGHCNLHLHAINHCDCDARWVPRPAVTEGSLSASHLLPQLAVLF